MHLQTEEQKKKQYQTFHLKRKPNVPHKITPFYIQQIHSEASENYLKIFIERKKKNFLHIENKQLCSELIFLLIKLNINLNFTFKGVNIYWSYFCFSDLVQFL